jgi:hypothetical protein
MNHARKAYLSEHGAHHAKLPIEPNPRIGHCPCEILSCGRFPGVSQMSHSFGLRRRSFLMGRMAVPFLGRLIPQEAPLVDAGFHLHPRYRAQIPLDVTLLKKQSDHRPSPDPLPKAFANSRFRNAEFVKTVAIWKSQASGGAFDFFTASKGTGFVTG